MTGRDSLCYLKSRAFIIPMRCYRMDMFIKNVVINLGQGINAE